jgi:hypothetical protein
MSQLQRFGARRSTHTQMRSYFPVSICFFVHHIASSCLSPVCLLSPVLSRSTPPRNRCAARGSARSALRNWPGHRSSSLWTAPSSCDQHHRLSTAHSITASTAPGAVGRESTAPRKPPPRSLSGLRAQSPHPHRHDTHSSMLLSSWLGLTRGVATGGSLAVPAVSLLASLTQREAAAAAAAASCPDSRQPARRYAGKTNEQQQQGEGGQWHWMVSQGHKVCVDGVCVAPNGCLLDAVASIHAACKAAE